MSIIAQAQLAFLVMGFLGGFVVPVCATLLLQRREGRFVKFWNSKGHTAQSDFESQLMKWSKMGSRLSMVCAVMIVTLWLIKQL